MPQGQQPMGQEQPGEAPEQPEQPEQPGETGE